LAVAAVLAFHGGVALCRGGFLGVDAFFVLSGFLITSLLLAERTRTGRVALVAFWGRRVRRLLPALLLLLSVVVIAGRWLLPATELAALRIDTLAALGYVANWRMTLRGGADYFAATAAPSPLQHTWSLGIEEQFYLLWPLLVVLLLARCRPVVLFWSAVVGVVASTATATVLFDPQDLDRVYYGTDTRAGSLLVGCALAALLALRAGASATRPPARRGGPLWFRALAVGATLGTAWLWTHADGGDPWLYRGGLPAAALAVAVVIAYSVEHPGSTTARLLALGPLVWLGRISYGVYLWHWPLFGWLSADRTGLAGAGLFAARCLATLVAATVSYLLVERPIRNRAWPTKRIRIAPAALAGGALAAVALLAVVATVPKPLPEPPEPVTAAAAPNSAPDPASRSPLRRAGRTPGSTPRIAFYGDSVAWSLGTYLPQQPGLTVTVRAVQGCGIARLPDVRYLGTPHSNYPGCDQWDARWRRDVPSDDPDLAVILLDRWELMDRRLGDEYRHVGQPDFDAYLNRELDMAIQIVSARGAHVVLLTAPYTRRAERPDGGLWPEDEPNRADAWNRLLRATAARRPTAVSVVDLNSRVCPDGRFTWEADNIRIRSDGLHFTPEGVQRWVSPWLTPQLAKLAAEGPG
jgi:peptidoglycan/LPS O-acetylase OafA/YrhL